MRLARLLICVDKWIKMKLFNDYERVRGHNRVLFFLDKEIEGHNE